MTAAYVKLVRQESCLVTLSDKWRSIILSSTIEILDK